MQFSKNIHKKLLEIKQEGIKLKKDKQGYGYKYADLSQIQEKLGPLLLEKGLLVIHSIEEGNVITSIMDVESEEHISSQIELSKGIKPQDKGSEITYYRRYNLVSLLDLEVIDDDGRKAQKSEQEFNIGYYVQRLKNTHNTEVLNSIYKEFMSKNPNDKQKEIFNKHVQIRKDQL